MIISGEKSEYKLRRPPFEQALSTFEAMANAMKVLEGENTFNEMMHNFRVFNNSFYQIRQGDNTVADVSTSC